MAQNIDDILRRIHNKANELRRFNPNNPETAELLEWAANQITRDQKEIADLGNRNSRMKLLLNQQAELLQNISDKLQTTVTTIKENKD